MVKNRDISPRAAMLLIILFFGFIASGYYFAYGNKTFSGLGLMLLGIYLFLGISMGGFIGLERLGMHVDFKKADEEELKREDDVLLQAVGFSQAALFIYLALVQGNEVITALKWLVPSVASLFFSIRGYAKIKNQSRYRYYSLLVLIFVLSLSFGSLLYSSFPQIFMFGENVNGFVLLPFCFSLQFPPIGLVRILSSKRYGCPDHNLG